MNSGVPNSQRWHTITDDEQYEFIDNDWNPSKQKEHQMNFSSRSTTPSELEIPSRQKEHQMNFASRSTTPEQDEVIAGAIGKAIRHTKRVCSREHIKADRIERVNHLITSLRREVSYLESMSRSIPADMRLWLQNFICDKAYWHDIGILTTSGQILSSWLQMANRQSGSSEAQSEMILADLEELERGLAGVNHTVGEVKRINVEGEALVEKLCNVFC